ncbi:MAG: macro domain-containing protein [Gemmatimonadetes bacterium]|nr:macro domain-containing protein [Gemmatimonadota bacterium]
MISVVRGALAETDAQALLRPVTAEWGAVNPAMRRLELAAGPEVDRMCRSLGELPVGSAVVTGAGELPAEFMVHVVVRSADVPVSSGAVGRALRAGLRRLEEWGVGRAAMPPLGTGAGNLDAEESAALMVPILMEHLETDRDPREIVIVTDSDYEQDVFERRLRQAGSVPTGDGELPLLS